MYIAVILHKLKNCIAATEKELQKLYWNEQVAHACNDNKEYWYDGDNDNGSGILFECQKRHNIRQFQIHKCYNLFLLYYYYCYIYMHLLALESYHRVTHQIIHCDLFTFANHFRMLANQKPTNVSKEKTSCSIVWVGIRFRILVVYSMVSWPFKNMILSENINEHTKHNKYKTYLKSHCLKKS